MAWYDAPWAKTAGKVLDPAGLFRHKKGPEQYQVDLEQNPRLTDAHKLRGRLGSIGLHSMQNVDDDFRQRQLATADRLQGVLTGEEAGAGELAARRAGQRAMAQQMAAANMARGSNAALAARSAAGNMGRIGTDMAGQAQQAAMQDQMAAQAQLGQILGQGRGQDVQTAQMMAQQQQMRDQARLQALQQMFGISDAEMRARQQQDQLRVQQAQTMMGLKPSSPLGDALGMVGQVGGAVAAFSDKRLKKDIEDESGPDAIDRMLDSLKPYSYEYKDPDDPRKGRGRHFGVMAQDLEKSKKGKELVEDTPEGKIVNYGKGLSTMMASIASIHERLKKVEAI